jgi:Na+-driven multidrug efflux pump
VSGTAYVLWFVAVLQPVNSVAFVLDGVLIGAGDGRFLAWAMAGAALLFAALAGGVLAAGGGLGLLWAAIGAFMTARAVSLLLRFRSPGWQVTGAARG